MNKRQVKKEVKRQLNAVFKSMDFVSKNFLNDERISKREAEVFSNIYQQLGIAWEFLGLQCRHWEGYKRTRDKKEACKICGKIKGTDDFYILVPKKGLKKLGVKVKPEFEKDI